MIGHSRQICSRVPVWSRHLQHSSGIREFVKLSGCHVPVGQYLVGGLLKFGANRTLMCHKAAPNPLLVRESHV